MKLDTKSLDKDILAPVFKAFNLAGFQLFYVGGCVRNVILKCGPTDIDLATDATPSQMRKVAEAMHVRVIPTGEDYGTLTFRLNRRNYEITTFRKDLKTDGRRALVEFGTSLEEDALRRDFTMNALYLGSEGTLIDPLSGIEDLNMRRVRFVGNASGRIKEDFLRILRFFRFYAWYGDPIKGIDSEGFAACKKLQSGLLHISKERIGSEIFKLLLAASPTSAIMSMESAGVLKSVLSGANASALPFLESLEGELKPNAIRRLALIGGPELQEQLRLSNSTARQLKQIRGISQNSELPQEHGFLLGEEGGWDSWLVRCALLGVIPSDEDRKTVTDSSTQIMPVKSADLVDWFEGQELGVALRKVQGFWVSSNMTLKKSDLIAHLLKEK